jgi:hypothetical protein
MQRANLQPPAVHFGHCEQRPRTSLGAGILILPVLNLFRIFLKAEVRVGDAVERVLTGKVKRLYSYRLWCPGGLRKPR